LTEVVSRIRLRRRLRPAEAEVTKHAEVEYRTKNGMTIKYRPVVRFTTAAGLTLEVQGRVATHWRRYRIGSRVRVLYDPAAPSDARLDDLVDQWSGVAMKLAIGALAFLFAYSLLEVYWEATRSLPG
jgi:hypothetical protein